MTGMFWVLAALCVTGSLAIRLPKEVAQAQVQLDVEARLPAFCHDLDCPKYSVIETYDKGRIELRSYRTSMWASIRLSGDGYDTASRKGIKILTAFFEGSNENAKPIDKTVPVTVRCVPAKDGPYTERDYIVSFMLPFNAQHKPPRPSKGSDVYIETLGSREFYVLAFDKWIDEFGLSSQASDLFGSLEDLDLKYDGSHFYSAVYNAPEDYKERHNEVWVNALSGKHEADAR